MYERCHQRYYYNDATRYHTLFDFIRLHFCVNRSVRTYPLERCYSSAVTPHALRARVVIVYRYILVLVRAHIFRINFYKIIRCVTRVDLFLFFFV